MKINQLLSGMNKNRPQLGQVLSPSWLSGLMSVVIGLAVVIGTVGLAHYNGSNFQLLRDQSQASQTRPIIDDYEELDTSFSANQLLSDIPLLAFWGGIGLVAYSL